MPELQELLQRIEALEKRKITIHDLPLEHIKQHVFAEPQDPNETLLPQSVTADLLDKELKEKLKI